MTKILNAFFNLPNSKTKFKQVFGLLMHIHMYLANNLGREGLLSAHFLMRKFMMMTMWATNEVLNFFDVVIEAPNIELLGYCRIYGTPIIMFELKFPCVSISKIKMHRSPPLPPLI